MEPVHILVAVVVATVASVAGVLALSGSGRAWLAELAARRAGPPAWALRAGVVLVALVLGMVVLRALGRGDDGTALLAVTALAVNQLTLVLGVDGRRPRMAMAGLVIFAATVLALTIAADWGPVIATTAFICAAWVVLNLVWTGRLAYRRTPERPPAEETVAADATSEPEPTEHVTDEGTPPVRGPSEDAPAEATPAVTSADHEPAGSPHAVAKPRRPGRHRRRASGLSGRQQV